MALLQNSLELAAMAFLDSLLICFKVPTKVLSNQGRDFLWTFKTLYTKALIDQCTTSRNHLKVDG